MNRLKLSYCGRINFWSAVNHPPKRLTPPTVLDVNHGRFSSDLQCATSERAIGAVSLGSSHAANLDSGLPLMNKTRRGCKGITSMGRSRVRGGCRYLESTYGVKNLVFLTATLPDSAVQCCTPETWALVVNRYLKKLRLYLAKAGLSEEIVGCTEIQERRLAKTNGVPPLHLHLVFQGRHPYGKWQYQPAFFQFLWIQTYRTVWQEAEPSVAACRVERIRSSAVSYLGKYLSKGGKVLSQCLPHLLPSSWYTLSRKLKVFLDKAEIKASDYLATEVYEYLQSSELLRWARDIWSPEHGNGSSYLVGWIGEFRDRNDYHSLAQYLTDSQASSDTEKYTCFLD